MTGVAFEVRTLRTSRRSVTITRLLSAALTCCTVPSIVPTRDVVAVELTDGVETAPEGRVWPTPV